MNHQDPAAGWEILLGLAGLGAGFGFVAGAAAPLASAALVLGVVLLVGGLDRHHASTMKRYQSKASPTRTFVSSFTASARPPSD